MSYAFEWIYKWMKMNLWRKKNHCEELNPVAQQQRKSSSSVSSQWILYRSATAAAAATSNHQSLRCQTEKASHNRQRHQLIVRKHPDVHTTLLHALALLRPLVISSRWMYISCVPLARWLYACMLRNVHNAYPELQWIVITFSYSPSLSRASCFSESHRFPSSNESVELFDAQIFTLSLPLSLFFHLISPIIFFGGHKQTRNTYTIYCQFSLIWCVRSMIRWLLSIFVNNNKMN